MVRCAPIRQGVVATDVPKLDLLPGSRSFRDVELLTHDDQQQSARLREHLMTGFNAYDFVLIDCPPSLGPLTKTALSSSTEVFMPIQCEYFAMEGLTQMIEVIRDVMQCGSGQLQFGGIVLTMYDHTLELTHEVDDEVREFFGEIVFRSVIPRDVAVSEAPSHGKPVIDYAPRSRVQEPMWSFAWRYWKREQRTTTWARLGGAVGAASGSQRFAPAGSTTAASGGVRHGRQ